MQASQSNGPGSLMKWSMILGDKDNGDWIAEKSTRPANTDPDHTELPSHAGGVM